MKREPSACSCGRRRHGRDHGFTGGETNSGSLADGRYTLTVFASQVSAGGQQLDGDGTGTGGDNFVLDGTVANGLY